MSDSLCYVGRQLEFAGWDNGVLWFSGLNNTEVCLGKAKVHETPDAEAVSLLLGHAQRFSMSFKPNAPTNIHVLGSDRVYRPTIDRELISLAMGARPSNTEPENKIIRLVVLIDKSIFGTAMLIFWCM